MMIERYVSLIGSHLVISGRLVARRFFVMFRGTFRMLSRLEVVLAQPGVVQYKYSIHEHRSTPINF